MPRRTNQGRPIDPVMDAVELGDLTGAATIGWAEVRGHGLTREGWPAGCECVAIEILAYLMERGYTIVKESTEGETE